MAKVYKSGRRKLWAAVCLWAAPWMSAKAMSWAEASGLVKARMSGLRLLSALGWV